MKQKGYRGKILCVNLSTREVTEEQLPEQVYRDYIGGVGLGVKLIHER
ncbi:aldehyde ferredoxin oxidoreductase N-terminal domain-containing protein [Chloroflexota bacterium]